MKKRLCIFILMLVMFMVTACSTDGSSGHSDGEKSEKSTTYTIGATQIVEHPSLDAAYEGFQDALADAGLDVEYDFQSAQNDQNNVSTISNNFVSANVDLIFANSTPSALGAMQATSDIPIVFTSVTDAVDAGLVSSMDEAGKNVTGVVDLHPEAIVKTVEFIDAYFSGSTVGLIYNSGEQNSIAQVESVQDAGAGTSLRFAERTVSNSAEVHQAATSIASDVDVFYIVTDNTVVSALDSVVGVANDQEIPLIVGEPDSLEKGGFATYGIDYYTIGYRTGEMAVDILSGEKDVSEIPPEYPPEIQLFINKQAAKEQGIEWNSDWDEAEFIETSPVDRE